MIMRKCKWCKKEFKNNHGNQKFCSKKCQRLCYYYDNKLKIINNAKRWGERNPGKKRKRNKELQKKWRDNNKEKIREYCKKYLTNNRGQQRSRVATGLIFNSWWARYGDNDVRKICKICRSRKKLEIHHEEYPENQKDILIAIRSGKIYYLCRRCHNKLHAEIRSVAFHRLCPLSNVCLKSLFFLIFSFPI